jgi:hypothetical protein
MPDLVMHDTYFVWSWALNAIVVLVIIVLLLPLLLSSSTCSLDRAIATCVPLLKSYLLAGFFCPLRQRSSLRQIAALRERFSPRSSCQVGCVFGTGELHLLHRSH